MVTQSEMMQDDLETVKADLAGTRLRAKKQSQELATAKRELKEVQEQLNVAQAEGTESITSSKSLHYPSKPKWPDAPIFTDGISPTFEAWAQKVVQKTDRTYSDPQDQIDYACARVSGRAEAYLAPRVRVGTPMPFKSRDEVLEFLCGIMADPNPRQTARHNLDALTQGKMEFAEFYGQFITQVIDLDYSEQAQIDILLDKVDKRLKRAWDMNANPPTTLNEVRCQLMTLDQNMRQTDKRFPVQQQQTASRFGTAKATASSFIAGSTPKPSTTTIPRATTTVTVRPRTFNSARLSEADVARYQKEGRCFKCGQQGHMKGDCPKNKPQIKNIKVEESSEE